MEFNLAIVGCGHLGALVARAVKDGRLPGYRMVAVMSQSIQEAQALAEEVGCAPCQTIDEVMAHRPSYVVEAASPTACRAIALAVLQGGADLIPLSIGAFADPEFKAEVATAATTAGRKVRLPSGAIGGFDVLRTVALMGNAAATMATEKGPNSLRGTTLFEEGLIDMGKQVFSGTPAQAIQILPTKVNVAIAASLATTGPEAMHFTVTSTPGYVGDDHRIEIENDQVRAVVDVYSKTSDIAGWSVVALLQNLAAPFVF